MTAMAMIIAMIPMALGLGEGGEQNAPLDRAVIGGLIFRYRSYIVFRSNCLHDRHQKETFSNEWIFPKASLWARTRGSTEPPGSETDSRPTSGFAKADFAFKRNSLWPKFVTDAGYGSRTLRLRRTILLLFLKREVETGVLIHLL
jgi:hypothetical protein